MALSLKTRLTKAARTMKIPLLSRCLTLAFMGLLLPTLALAKDVVLVLRPQAEVFAEVAKGMTGDLGEDVQFIEVMVEGGAIVVEEQDLKGFLEHAQGGVRRCRLQAAALLAVLAAAREEDEPPEGIEHPQPPAAARRPLQSP